jgi:cell division protein FtsA
MRRQTVITAVDVGTTKICAVLATPLDERRLEVRGVGTAESHGIEKGVVLDIQGAADSIREAVDEAERSAGLKADNLFIGISGEHIRSRNALGRVSLSDSSGLQAGEINQEHIDTVINDAQRTVKLQQGNENMQIIHGIPQYFDIDNLKGIQRPLRMNGFHLTAHVHVVLAEMNAIRNTMRCFEIAGYPVRDLVCEPLASAQAVLNEDERNLGCVIIDIGGGATDIALYFKNSIRFSTVKPFGGETVTNDLAIGLKTPPKAAERVKLDYANALSATVSAEDFIDVPNIGGNEMQRRKLRFVCEIVEFRVREMLEMAYKTIFESYNQDLMTAGLILTGGASQLRNIDKLAQEVFNMPVKIGKPDLSLLGGSTQALDSPAFSTVVGLLYEALSRYPQPARMLGSTPAPRGENKMIQTMRGWYDKIKDFI